MTNIKLRYFEKDCKIINVLSMILDSPLKRFAIGVVLICWVVSSCTVVKNPTAKSVSKDNSLIEAARAYMGVPYKLGGNDHKGIDCSGLICNSFKKIGIELPRISWQQSDYYPTIRAEDIRKGDLVFFYTGGSFVNHVGIVTEVKSNGSTAAAIFNNIASTSVGLATANTDQDATFTFTTAAVAGAADTASLSISNQTAGTITIAGVETLNVNSTGGANTLTALTAAAATTLNFSGDTTLDLGTANTVATTITSTNTAGITLTSNTATAATITGGAGNDSITLTGGAAVNERISAGAGNDTVTFSANLPPYVARRDHFRLY